MSLAPQNIPVIEVTCERSHAERSPSKEMAFRNMYDVLVTRKRSGASVACNTMFEAPLMQNTSSSTLPRPTGLSISAWAHQHDCSGKFP